MLTTRVQALALSTRHAIADGWSLQAEGGQTRERFDDPTGFTPRGDARVRNLAAALSWAIAPQHELQFGLESRHDRFVAPGTPGQERDTDSARVAWLGSWQDAWQLQAHLRHDRSSDFGRANTGLLALGYTIAPAWKASASVSSGFSAPSFTELAFDADPSTPLRAERSRQAELALQWRDAGASVRAALFVQRQRDRVRFDPITFDATNVARAQPRLRVDRTGTAARRHAQRRADAAGPAQRRRRHAAAAPRQAVARAGLERQRRRLGLARRAAPQRQARRCRSGHLQHRDQPRASRRWHSAWRAT